MDSITHSLTGAVIARAVDDEKVGNWGTIAGTAMGIFPDSDFVLGLFNGQFHLQYHRAFTHSLLLLPFYALFFSWIFVKLSKRRYLWSYYKICFLVLLSHILLDLLTSYGTIILSPFSDRRFAWDLTFIVDLVFSGIIVIPWLVSLVWRRKAQWICRGALSVLILYILFCGVQHHRAIELGKSFAINLNEEVLEVASLPQPLSPFRWANYIETKDRVYQGFVDLLMRETSRPDEKAETKGNSSFFLGRWIVMKGLYEPPSKVKYSSWQKQDNSPWVKKALNTDGVKFYYWFARFPVVKSVNYKEGKHRVEFVDVRFLLPGLRMPFVYYVEFNDSGEIQSEGFERDGKKARK